MIKPSLFSRKFAFRSLALLLLLGVGATVPALFGTPAATAAEVQKTLTVKGTCVFGNKTNPWSATLTPKGDGTYDAAYDSVWNGKGLSYVGTVKSDLKTMISGTGKAINGKGNGNFELSGKYGPDGIAKCSYKEIGGRRTGTMTAELPK